MSEKQVDEVWTGLVVRRFAVFGGEVYYASGGFQDFQGSFDDILEAFDFATGRRSAFEGSDHIIDACEWWHIFDMDKRCVVFQSKCQAFGAGIEYPKHVVI
jgi:hypothetical protein